MVLTLHRSWVLTNPAAPSISEMTLQYLSLFSNWHSPFFVLHCFFVSFHISSLWCGQWWCSFLLCGLSTIVYSLSLCLNLWPGESRLCAREGHCWVRTAWGACMRTSMIDTSQTIPLARIGCVQERWILANQIRVTGWTHRQWTFSQLICILFYCQIVMTISTNITKK